MKQLNLKHCLIPIATNQVKVKKQDLDLKIDIQQIEAINSTRRDLLCHHPSHKTPQSLAVCQMINTHSQPLVHMDIKNPKFNV